jgi:hypothetical protein
VRYTASYGAAYQHEATSFSLALLLATERLKVISAVHPYMWHVGVLAKFVERVGGRGARSASDEPRDRPRPIERTDMKFHWFLPTNGGDERHVVSGGHGVEHGATDRPASVPYLGQVARSAEQLGFEAVLTPTGPGARTPGSPPRCSRRCRSG